MIISERTVEIHIINIYRKLGVKNRIQLLNLFRAGDVTADGKHDP